MKRGDSITVCTDSAISMRRLLGKSRQKRILTLNTSHIKAARRDLSALKRHLGYGKVHIRKVRGHSEDAWNNAADTLAGLGRDQGGANDDQKTEAVRLAMRIAPPPGDHLTT